MYVAYVYRRENVTMVKQLENSDYHELRDTVFTMVCGTDEWVSGKIYSRCSECGATDSEELFSVYEYQK